MKICPMVAEMFQANGQTDRQTCRSWQSLFANLRTILKRSYEINISSI